MPFFTGISRAIGGGGFGKSRRFSGTRGGIKYTSGAYTIHKFVVSGSSPFGQPGSTTTDTFAWDGPAPAPLSNADILVIGGGGSGGSGGHHGGGGGAGGYTYISGFDITALGDRIPVSVGKGGRGSGLGGPENGDPSSFGPVTSYGGGRGGSSGYGSAGGSTGGWGTYFQPGATNYGGAGAGPGGNHPNSIANAGGGARNEGISNRGGGGGGAGGAGNYGDNYPGVSPQDGSGGPGLSNSIDGTSVTYAAGGASGTRNTFTLDRGNGGDGYGVGASSGATVPYSHPAQRENDYRSATVVSGLTGYVTISATLNYNWTQGGSLSQTIQIRDSSNNAIASNTGYGSGGTVSVSALTNASSTYSIWIDASSYLGATYAVLTAYGSVVWRADQPGGGTPYANSGSPGIVIVRYLT